MDFEEDPPQNSESDDDLVSLEDIDGLNKGQLKAQLIKALSRLVNADEQIESLQRKAELLKSDLARAESGVNKLKRFNRRLRSKRVWTEGWRDPRGLAKLMMKI